MAHYGETVVFTNTCKRCESEYEVAKIYTPSSYCQSCRQKLARPEHVNASVSLTAHEHDWNGGYVEATVTLTNNNPVTVRPDLRAVSDSNRETDDESHRFRIVGWIRFETDPESAGAAEQVWIDDTAYQSYTPIRANSSKEMSFRWSVSQVVQTDRPDGPGGGALGTEFRQRVSKHEGNPMNAETVHVRFQPTNTEFFGCEAVTATTNV